MGLMNIRWMNIVLEYVGRLMPAPLAFTVVNSIPYGLFTHESTLRRYISLPKTVFGVSVLNLMMLTYERSLCFVTSGVHGLCWS